MNWFPLKSVTIGKRGNVLSCAGGKILKPAVAHDAGVARYFDEYVFKTKPEAERSVSFIFSGYDRARRVDIVKAVRLRDRVVSPQNEESPQRNRQLDYTSRAHDRSRFRFQLTEI
jgi:hypothetical protein